MTIKLYVKNIGLSKSFNYFLDSLLHLPYAEALICDGELTGKGEIACAFDINGEFNASVILMEQFLNKILKDTVVENEQHIEDVMCRLNLFLANNSGLKCGVEQALFNILSQKISKPLPEILIPKHERISVQITIPTSSNLETYKQDLSELPLNNVKFVKFKIGNNLDLEGRIITHFCENYPKINVSMDANQCFLNDEGVLKFLGNLPQDRISWIEQPLEKNNLADLEKLKNKISIPIMIDEGLHDSKDALLYAKMGLADLFNLKLAKCGGVFEARKIMQYAQKYNMPVILGSMLHGELGFYYNLSFAFSQNFITHDFYSYFSLNDFSADRIIQDNLDVNLDDLCKIKPELY